MNLLVLTMNLDLKSNDTFNVGELMEGFSKLDSCSFDLRHSFRYLNNLKEKLRKGDIICVENTSVVLCGLESRHLRDLHNEVLGYVNDRKQYFIDNKDRICHLVNSPAFGDFGGRQLDAYLIMEALHKKYTYDNTKIIKKDGEIKSIEDRRGIISLDKIAEERKGICKDYAATLAVLYIIEDFEVNLITFYSSNKRIGHMVVDVKVGANTFMSDPTLGIFCAPHFWKMLYKKYDFDNRWNTYIIRPDFSLLKRD